MVLKAAIAVLSLIILLAVLFCYITYNHTVDLGDRVVSIIINRGNTLNDVTKQLLSEGVVASRFMLVYPARLSGIDKKLTPGRYDFTGKNSCRSVLEKFETADFVKIKVTIPEGSTVWETVSIISKKLNLDSTAIMNFNDDSTFLKEHKLPSLEGYLFPETYFFPWGVNDTSVIEEIISMYFLKTDSIWPDNIIMDLTRYEILKLASIIEAETGLDDERGLVSSVYHNRLKKRMKLDADPTVIYGLGGLERPLSKRDLKKNTPYNTYLHRGFPPTPINSPGLASILAALNPDKSDYLYFVADENGRHFFSKTNAEHNRAKRRIKSSRKQK